MEVSLKKYMNEHMENKTTITIPVVLRNKLVSMMILGIP